MTIYPATAQGPAALLAYNRENAQLRTSAVMAARSFEVMRVREELGKNRGRWVDVVHLIAGHDPKDAGAWCAEFVITCWTDAGMAVGMMLDCHVSGSCADWMAKAKADGLWLSREDAVARIAAGEAPADVVPHGACMIRLEATGNHAELVVHAKPDGGLVTIGGNTNGEDSREGDGVYYHDGRYTLAQSRVAGFCLPRWKPLFSTGTT